MPLVYAVAVTWAGAIALMWLSYRCSMRLEEAKERRLRELYDLEYLYRMDAVEPRRRLT